MNCTTNLQVALVSDTSIGPYLDKEGLIMPEVFSRISDTQSKLSREDKAAELVTAIKNKVKLNYLNYHKLLHYFQQNHSKYRDILGILEKEYYSLLSKANGHYPNL